MEFSIYLWKFETIGNWTFLEIKVFLLNCISFAIQNGKIKLDVSTYVMYYSFK